MKNALITSVEYPFFSIFLSLSSLFLHFFFLTSARLLDSATATVILELWPVAAFFFAKYFIKKPWQNDDFGVYLSMVLSILGLGVVFSPYIQQINEVSISTSSFGILIAILASFASGATVLHSELAQRVSRENGLRSSAETVSILRIIAIPPALVCAILFDNNPLEFSSALWGAAFGIIVYGFASMFAIAGVRYASSLKSILLWFVTPALGIIFLSGAIGTPIFPETVFGFSLIFFANSVLNFGGLRRLSIFVSYGFLLLFTFHSLYSEGRNHPDYFNSLFLLTTFFIIFITSIIQRRSAQISSAIERLTSFYNKEKIADHKLIDPDLVVGRNNLIVLETRRAEISFSITELLSATFVSIIIVCVALFFRSNTFLVEMISIAVAFSVIFLTMYSIELSLPATIKRILIQATSQSDVTSFSLSLRTIVSAATLFVLSGSLLILLLDKHGFVSLEQARFLAREIEIQRGLAAWFMTLQQ